MGDRRSSAASARSVPNQENSGPRPPSGFLSKLKMTKLDPPQPAKVEQQEPVVELHIRDYMAIVMNPDKDVLVEYYTLDVPFSNHCRLIITVSVL
jgi:hypothetical protein